MSLTYTGNPQTRARLHFLDPLLNKNRDASKINKRTGKFTTCLSTRQCRISNRSPIKRWFFSSSNRLRCKTYRDNSWWIRWCLLTKASSRSICRGTWTSFKGRISDMWTNRSRIIRFSRNSCSTVMQWATPCINRRLASHSWTMHKCLRNSWSRSNLSGASSHSLPNSRQLHKVPLNWIKISFSLSSSLSWCLSHKSFLKANRWWSRLCLSSTRTSSRSKQFIAMPRVMLHLNPTHKTWLGSWRTKLMMSRKFRRLSIHRARSFKIHRRQSRIDDRRS